jgi:hypothetical protein
MCLDWTGLLRRYAVLSVSLDTGLAGVSRNMLGSELTYHSESGFFGTAVLQKMR